MASSVDMDTDDSFVVCVESDAIMSAARVLVLIKKYDSKWILAGEPQLYSSGRGRAARLLGDMTHASRPGFRDNVSTACSNGEV